MVPIYAIASFISLFSLQAAFFIDVIRDIYEVSLCLLPGCFIVAGVCTGMFGAGRGRDPVGRVGVCARNRVSERCLFDTRGLLKDKMPMIACTSFCSACN